MDELAGYAKAALFKQRKDAGSVLRKFEAEGVWGTDAYLVRPVRVLEVDVECGAGDSSFAPDTFVSRRQPFSNRKEVIGFVDDCLV